LKTCIFVGPTLPEAEIREILPDASVFPPAEQGDLEFGSRCGFDIIALIDGVHSQRLPVWHKEILQCLQKGARVLGASSMGALRAVECQPYGAVPIGQVAEWYSQGILDSDDEVCLSHLGSQQGYRKMSLPLVNIRASLISAQVGSVRQQEIIEAARGIFYPERTWPRVFDACEADDAERTQILACEIDIKAADALHLCYYISKLPEKPKAEWEIKNHNKGYGSIFIGNDRKVWNGKHIVRQHEIAHPQFLNDAMNRALALEFCKMAGISEAAPETDQIDLDIDKEDFKRLRDEEATLAKAREWLSNSACGYADVPLVIDHLRVSGMYKTVRDSI
jgi:hypothetical protein